MEARWHELLPDDLLVRPRKSRIFYGGRFYDYPLKPTNALVSRQDELEHLRDQVRLCQVQRIQERPGGR